MARTGLFLIALLIALVAAGAGLMAFEPALDLRSLSDAIGIGLSRMDDERSRFHAAYHVSVVQPPLDYGEVVTPFRRVALDSEAHTRAGGRLYGQREALGCSATIPRASTSWPS